MISILNYKTIVISDVHISNGKRFYAIHGDIFDIITTNLRWLANLGDIGYTFLLWLNKRYNNVRIKNGMPYYSLSKIVKNKVKRAVSFLILIHTQGKKP